MTSDILLFERNNFIIQCYTDKLAGPAWSGRPCINLPLLPPGAKVFDTYILPQAQCDEYNNYLNTVRFKAIWL